MVEHYFWRFAAQNVLKTTQINTHFPNLHLKNLKQLVPSFSIIRVSVYNRKV